MLKNTFNKLANKLIAQQTEVNLFQHDANGNQINYRTGNFGNYNLPFEQVFPYQKITYWDYFLLTYTRPDENNTVNHFTLTDQAMKILMPGIAKSPSFNLFPKIGAKIVGFLTDGTQYEASDYKVIGWSEDENKVLTYKLIYTASTSDYSKRNDISNYKVIETAQHYYYGISWDDEHINKAELLPNFDQYNSTFQEFLMKYTCPYVNQSGTFVKSTFKFLPQAAAKFNSTASTKWTINYKLAKFNSLGHLVFSKISGPEYNSFILAIAYAKDIEVYYTGHKYKVNAYMVSTSDQEPQNENEIKVIQFNNMSNFLMNK